MPPRKGGRRHALIGGDEEEEERGVGVALRARIGPPDSRIGSVEEEDLPSPPPLTG